MKLTANNYMDVISRHMGDASSSAPEGTWRRSATSFIDRDALVHFYDNEWGKGLVEGPEKTPRWARYSPGQSGSLAAVKAYGRAKLRAPLDHRDVRRDGVFVRESGVVLPDYRPTHAAFYFDIQGKAFNANLRKYVSFLGFLNNCADMSRVANVCEIGAGYGGLCELMLINKPIKTYVIIDLFFTLAVSMTYLLETPGLKDACNFVYVESLADLKELEACERNVLFVSTANYTSFVKQHLREYVHPDLFINTNSMVEMPRSCVLDYFEFMQQFDGAYFLSSNAVRRVEGDEVMSALDFPYDHKWEHLREVLVVRDGDLTRLSRR